MNRHDPTAARKVITGLAVSEQAREPDEDQPATRRFWAAIPAAAAAFAGPGAHASALFPWDDDEYDDDAGRALFASGEVPPDAVGYAGTYPARRQVVVHDIYVVAEFTRRGVATALLGAARKAGRAPLAHRGLTDEGRLLWAATVGVPADGYMRS